MVLTRGKQVRNPAHTGTAPSREDRDDDALRPPIRIPGVRWQATHGEIMEDDTTQIHPEDVIITKGTLGYNVDRVDRFAKHLSHYGSYDLPAPTQFSSCHIVT